MCFGVACSALAAGHHVYGFDVNIANQDRFLAKGGDRAKIADAGAVSDVVISVVVNGSQTIDILFGELGIVKHLRPGSEDAFAAAKPALDAITQTVYQLGDTAGPG